MVQFKKKLSRTLQALKKNYFRFFIILLLGFSSGVPLALTGGTLQAWMASEKVDLTLIGIFSLVSLPYTLKFLWAPFLDRFVLPFLGRRRGWMFLIQVILALCIASMAFCDPGVAPGVLAILAVLVAFSSASQDIVVDAYRTEVLKVEEYGTGAAIATFSYRLGMIFSSAIALVLADFWSWKAVYLVMALSIGVGCLATLIGSEPILKVKIPKTLKEVLTEPLLDFFRRKNVLGLLSFIVFYKLDSVVALALMTPFMLELGFTKTDIGTVSKGFGLFASLFGTLIGGIWLSKIGIRRSLWLFGVFQAISGLSFYVLAQVGNSYPMLIVTIGSENFFSGMGNAAYAAFIMSLCNPKFTATQFAVLTSLMAVTRTIAGAPTGWLAKSVGWEVYFIIAVLLSIPGFLLLTQFNKWQTRSK